MRIADWRHLPLCLAFGLATSVAVGQPVPPRSPPPAAPAAPTARPAAPSVQVRTLELRDITFGTPETGTVAFGRVTFTGFVSGADTAKADEATFGDIVVTVGDQRAEIPIATVSGFEVPVEFFRAMTEGSAAPLDWSRFLQKATVSEVVLQSLNIKHGGDVETSVPRIVLKSFAGGRFANLSIESFFSQDKDDEKASFRTGEIALTGVDAGELFRFWRGGGSPETKPLLERAVLNDTALLSKDGNLNIGKIELAGIDGRAPARTPGDQTVLPSGLTVPKSRPQVATNDGAYLREALRFLRVNRLAIERVALSAAGMGEYQLGSFSLTDFSSRGFTLLELKEINFAAPQAGVKLERLAIEKVSYGGIVDTLLDAAAAGTEPDFSPQTFGKIQPRIGAIRLAKLNLDTPAGPISLDDARIEVDNPDVPMPERLTFAIGGLKVDLAKWSDNPGAEKLRGFGYTELSADAQIQVRVIPGEHALLIENTGATADKVGRFELGLRFGDVELTPTASDPDEAERIMSKARLESLTFRLLDLGFANRLFADLARTAGLPEEAVRTTVALEAKNEAAANFGSALSASSLDALEAFIRSPRRIEAKITPRPGTPPLRIGELENMPPPVLLQRLQIELTLPN